jgi:hypothetical protein
VKGAYKVSSISRSWRFSSSSLWNSEFTHRQRKICRALRSVFDETLEQGKPLGLQFGGCTAQSFVELEILVQGSKGRGAVSLPHPFRQGRVGKTPFKEMMKFRHRNGCLFSCGWLDGVGPIMVGFIAVVSGELA